MSGRSLTIAAAATAVGLAAATAGGAAPTGHAKTVGCRHQSGGGFPHAFTKPENVVVGAFAFSSLRRGRTENPDVINHFGGWKSPALLRVGHRAVVSIDNEARPWARLAYTHSSARFSRQPHTMRFIACATRAQAISRADGRPITFWSGFFMLKHAPACVGITISVDGRPARHRMIALGRPRCP